MLHKPFTESVDKEDNFKIFEATPGIRGLLLPNAPHYTIVGLTDDAIKVSGLSRDQLIGQSIFVMFPANPEDPDFTGQRNLSASFEHVTTYKTAHQMPLQRYDVAQPDSSFDEKYWQYYNSPVLDEDGNIKYIIHACEDVTDKVKSAQRATITQNNFEYFFNQARAPFAIIKGRDFIFSFANPAYTELLNGRQLVGKTVLEAIPELKDQPFIKLLEQVYESGVPFHASEIPATAIFNKGEVAITRYFNLSYTPYKNEKGETEGILASGYDITEQVELRKKEQISKLNEQAYSLFMQAPIPISIFKGPDFIIELSNDASMLLAGTTKDVIGKPLLEVFPEAEAQGFIYLLQNVVKTGQPYHAIETPVTFKYNGIEQTRYINLVYQPYYESDGSISGVIAISNDITEQVISRKKVEVSEMRFRNVVEQAPDPIFILKGENMVLDVANEPLLNLWNIGRDAIGKAFLEILPEMKDQGFLELLVDVYHSGRSYYGYEMPAVFLRANGMKETTYFDFVYQPYRETDGSISGVLVIATIVTERVLLKQKQAETENNFKNLVMQAPVGICILKAPELIFETANNLYLELAMLTWNSIEGKKFQDVFADVAASTFIDPLKNVILNGKAFHGKEYEIELIRKELKKTIHIDFVYEPLKEPDGTISRIMVLVIDVSDKVMARKKIEESEKELQKRVKERTAELEKKNNELEQFAHVSSHDLQEPLRKIRLFTEMIMVEDYDRLSELSKSRFEKITDAAFRMSSSLSELLNFTSLTKEEQFIDTDLNEIVKSVETDLEVVIEQKNALIHRPILPTIKAIPLQMHQLFYNLLNNALKFSKPGTAPIVDISYKKLTNDKKLNYKDIDLSKDYFEIVITDNGIGFEELYADKIFMMFQRLHDRQKFVGTGIGLAICKKVAINHGGQIYAISKPNLGSAFHVALPFNMN